jgi:hypothetical protein
VKDERTRAEVLHARLAPVINRLVWSFLGVDPDRDDLVHDIFIRILRSAHTVRDPAKLEGWAAPSSGMLSAESCCLPIHSISVASESVEAAPTRVNTS